nr:MAG TPA: hypothetical protein [Caudoviricetes sp.]
MTVKNGPLSLPLLIFGLNGKRRSKKKLNGNNAGAAGNNRWPRFSFRKKVNPFGNHQDRYCPV